MDTALYTFIPKQRRGIFPCINGINFLFLDSETGGGKTSHHCRGNGMALIFSVLKCYNLPIRWRGKSFLFLSSSPSARFQPHFNAGEVKAGGGRRKRWPYEKKPRTGRHDAIPSAGLFYAYGIMFFVPLSGCPRLLRHLLLAVLPKRAAR